MSSIVIKRLKEFGGLDGIEPQAILATALRRGADFLEIYFEETDDLRVIMENGRLERVLPGLDRGAGIRLIAGGSVVYGYTTDLSQASLMTLAETLSAGLDSSGNPRRVSSIDWSRRRAGPALDSLSLPTGVERRLDLLERAEFAAREECPEATHVRTVHLDQVRKTLVLNSDGGIATDVKPAVYFVVEVVAQRDARVESAHETDGGRAGLEFFEKRTPESIARAAAARARLLLSAVPAPSGRMPVVLAAEAGGVLVHEAVGHGLEADLVTNGISVFRGKVGKQVASPLITVIDDGTIIGAVGSAPFDDEGNPGQKTVLLENGVLQSYMVDRLSAMKLDISATGNGRRQSFRHRPMARMTNTYIAAGCDSSQTILAETTHGIYVKAIAGGQVRTGTGDFVFSVTEGYLIQDGVIGAAIQGATLVGNGPTVMAEVDRVGNDLAFSTGMCGKSGQSIPVSYGQPTLRIPSITVGGLVPQETYWKRPGSNS